MKNSFDDIFQTLMVIFKKKTASLHHELILITPYTISYNAEILTNCQYSIPYSYSQAIGNIVILVNLIHSDNLFFLVTRRLLKEMENTSIRNKNKKIKM